eukprot:scaffold1934_cov444-Prasinococcus_capsulatus_cf.AAC.4
MQSSTARVPAAARRAMYVGSVNVRSARTFATLTAERRSHKACLGFSHDLAHEEPERVGLELSLLYPIARRHQLLPFHRHTAARPTPPCQSRAQVR